MLGVGPWPISGDSGMQRGGGVHRGVGPRRGLVGAFASLLAVLVCVGLGSGCSRGEPAAREGPLRVVVTIPPLVGLARALAPSGSEVTSIMQPGRSPHGYEFTPGDIAALAGADLVVAVGLGLDGPVQDVVARADRRGSGPVLVVFADAVGVRAEPGDEHDHAAHGHGAHEHTPGEACDHGSVDPHLWVDPSLVCEFVPALRGAVEAALERRGVLTSEARAGLDNAERRLIADLTELDRQFIRRLLPFKGAALVTHHAAFGRLADRYGLEVAAVLREVESAEATPGAVERIVSAVRERGVRTIFIEPQYDAREAERIAKAAGVGVAMLDDIGDGDYFRMMESNLETLERGLAAPGDASPERAPSGVPAAAPGGAG